MSVIEIVVMDGDPFAHLAEGEYATFNITGHVARVSQDQIDASSADEPDLVLQGVRRVGMVAKERDVHRMGLTL